jgi:hypothetical protein
MFALAVGVLTFCQLSRGQEGAGGFMAGTVFDAQGNAPLADAIVFVSGTAIGTSTATDGTFRLGPILPGTYDVVASRVGYARLSSECTVMPAETLTVVFRLQVRPVESGGIDVLGARDTTLASAGPLFLPEPAEGQYTLFPFPELQPVGALFTSGALYLYSVGTLKLDGEPCLSVWLLYQNLLDTARSFDPVRDISVSVVSTSGAYPAIAPLPIEDVRPIVSPDSARRLIVERVEPFFSAARRVTDLIRPGISRKFGPMDAAFGTDPDFKGRLKIRYNIPATPNRTGASAGYLTRTFGGSTHLGLLSRAHVSPGAALDGMLFVLLPGLAPSATTMRGAAAISSTSYTLRIKTSDGVREVLFHAR